MIGLLLAMSLAFSSAPPWELIGLIGPYRTVYVEPMVYQPQDQQAVSRLLAISAELLGAEQQQKSSRPVIVDFFTERSMTPTALPYTEEQKKVWKARVVYPADGERSFEWHQK